jgi:uncharacterized membrane protein
MRCLADFLNDRRGSIAVIAAASMTAMVGFTALGVDLANVYLQTRQLQGIADLAAMGAANDVQNAQATAAATVGANKWNGTVQTVAVAGTYEAASTLPANQRFSAGGAAPNAVQVTLTAPANLFFGQFLLGRSTINISRQATAASAQLASFSIGSGLVAVQNGVANALLTDLTGSQISLSAMDYNALVSAHVDLLQYTQALQTRLKLQGVSFGNVLSDSVSTSVALAALASVLNTSGQSAAALAINQIVAAADTSNAIQLQNLVNLGPYAAQDHGNDVGSATISVQALNLTNAILELAQGDRQVQLSLGASIPGLTNVNVWLAIGQRPANSPWLTVNGDGSVVISTAQARIYVDSKVSPGAGLLSGAGVSLIDIPIYIQLASAQAKLSSLSCSATGDQPAVVLDVEPSLGQIALGQINTANLANFGQQITPTPATLVNAAVLNVKGQAQTDLGGAAWQTVAFTQSDIQLDAVKTVSTNDLVQATATSLLANTSLSVQVLGLGIGLGQSGVSSAVQSSLSTAAAPIDQTINALTSLLGVQLGYADVQVNGLRCNDVALVS